MSEPVAWRIQELSGNWIASSDPGFAESWERRGWTVEPLYDAATLEQVVAERDVNHHGFLCAIAERDVARAQDEALRKALGDARTSLKDWGDYVPNHWKEKHGFEGDLAAIDAALYAPAE